MYIVCPVVSHSKVIVCSHCAHHDAHDIHTRVLIAVAAQDEGSRQATNVMQLLPKTQVREASNLPRVLSLTKKGFVVIGNSLATAAQDSDKRQHAPSLFLNRLALEKDPQ